MANKVLDAVGLKCPQPVLKITVAMTDIEPGDTLEVVGDCPTFEKDIRTWCERLKKPLLWMRNEGGAKMRCQIQF